jgi:hypothetical protein
MGITLVLRIKAAGTVRPGIGHSAAFIDKSGAGA